MKSQMEYFDEIGYQIDKTNRKIIKYATTPEDSLMRNEEKEEIFEEKQEIIQGKMREIFFNTFQNVLTKSEKKFLRQMMFGIDRYYPDEETQKTVANRLNIKREYYVLLMHRVCKKIEDNKYLKSICKKQLNEYCCNNNS